MIFRLQKAALFISLMAVSGIATGADFKPGEVIVKYKDGTVRARSEVNALYDSVGVKSVRRYSGMMTGYEHLILDEKADVQAVIRALRLNHTVDYAQPNYILHTLPLIASRPQARVRPADACLIPGLPFPPGCDDGTGGDPGGTPPGGTPGGTPGGNPGGDPSTPPAARPALNEPPQALNPPVADPDLNKSYGMAKISAVSAWKIYGGSKDFIVADIDTGIDYNHEDISFNMWRNPNPDAAQKDIVGFDFVHNDGLPFDDNEHGTHTGGTIAAVGGNGVGTSGVVQRVSLMALKFLSGQGDGTTADAIRAIDYAIQHGARVLSNSWGGPGDTDNQALKDAIERAKSKNVLFVAAAGNDGTDNDSTPAYPAAFNNDNIIAVAATDQNDGLAFFSNYGKTTTHVAAPGVDVYSTLPGNKYGNLSGTSMACPHVAGAAALIWSRHPKWTYKQVKSMLMKTVDPLASLSGKVVTGGRINVLKALQTADAEDSDTNSDNGNASGDGSGDDSSPDPIAMR